MINRNIEDDRATAAGYKVVAAGCNTDNVAIAIGEADNLLIVKLTLPGLQMPGLQQVAATLQRQTNAYLIITGIRKIKESCK